MFKQLTQPKFGQVATRFVAFALDLFIVSIVYGVIIAVITGDFTKVFSRFSVSTGNGNIDVLLAATLLLLYFSLQQGLWNGQTIGMKSIGIAVRKEDGSSVAISSAFLRNVIFFATTVLSLGITVIVNYFLLVFTAKQRTIHDFLSKTNVVNAKTLL